MHCGDEVAAKIHLSTICKAPFYNLIKDRSFRTEDRRDQTDASLILYNVKIINFEKLPLVSCIKICNNISHLVNLLNGSYQIGYKHA